MASTRNVLLVSTIEETDTGVLARAVLDWIREDEKASARRRRWLNVPPTSCPASPRKRSPASRTWSSRSVTSRHLPAEEIVVAARPDQQEGTIEAAATETAPRRSFEGVPVRYVVVPD